MVLPPREALRIQFALPVEKLKLDPSFGVSLESRQPQFPKITNIISIRPFLGPRYHQYLLAVATVKGVCEKLTGGAKIPSPGRNGIKISACFITTGCREKMRVEEREKEKVCHQQQKAHKRHQIWREP